MGFAETFEIAVGAALRQALEGAARLDMAAISRPWLVMVYQVTRATVPVLQYAQMRSDEAGLRELGRYYAQKAREEAGHDEMCLVDLEFAGIDRTAAQNWPANPFIAESVGRQYYLIDFVHPSAYLGYVGLLEGFLPTSKQIDELQRASGLPRKALRTTRFHAAVDVKHRKDFFEMLGKLPAEFHPNILANALRCCALQAGALAHLSQEIPHDSRSTHSSLRGPADDGTEPRHAAGSGPA